MSNKLEEVLVTDGVQRLVGGGGGGGGVDIAAAHQLNSSVAGRALPPLHTAPPGRCALLRLDANS